MLGRVQSMGLDLLNQVAKETETGPEVWGCQECHLIFDFAAYSFPSGEPLSVCPGCGANGADVLLVLGPLPCIITKGPWIYLTDDDGRTSRAYRTIQEAHQDLWAWFVKKEDHDGYQEEGVQEGDQEEGDENVVPLHRD